MAARLLGNIWRIQLDYDDQERVISLLRSVNRPGMDIVIDSLEAKGYFDAKCYGHHRYKGGMSAHALEVYDYVMANNSFGLPADSICIAALFHDFGKAVRRISKYTGEHPERSVILLDELGLELTDSERTAIGCHHRKDFTFVLCPLRRLLSMGDCASTGAWKRAHAR